MKVKIIRAIDTVKGKLNAGDIVTVKPITAERWIQQGIAKKVNVKNESR